LLTRLSILASLQALDGYQARLPINLDVVADLQIGLRSPEGQASSHRQRKQRALVGLYWCDFAGLRQKEGACI
jgi:hypothetical protein